nr:MAG: hypothetical protein [Tombusviridae sp.]
MAVNDPGFERAYGFYVGEDGVVRFQDPPGAAPLVDTTEADRVCALLDGYYEKDLGKVGPVVCVVTKWGFEWIKNVWKDLFCGESLKTLSGQIIKEFDEVKEEPTHYMEEHIVEHNKIVVDQETQIAEVETVRRVSMKLKKGQRSKFSVSVAHLAYNKFGERPMTEANVLVTRKWLQKFLDDPKYKDLRTVDRNTAIDRALFLSFLPTESFRLMALVRGTRAWEDRTDPTGVLKQNLFGRVFRLVRHNVAELERA